MYRDSTPQTFKVVNAITPQQLVARANDLVTLPRAYHRISEMLDDPRFGAADVGKVISHDPALTARLLRLVNSAYYGFPSRIDSVPMAITVVGTRALRELVLATSVASAFDSLNTQLVDVSDFWHHSIYCGIMARLLARHLKLGEADRLFVAGLLHDIGKLVMYMEAPGPTSEILQQFAQTDEPLFSVEETLLGFTHADVGGELLRVWQLPEIYQQSAAFHHALEKAAPEHADSVAVVHVANALTKKVEPGHKVREDRRDMPHLHPDAARRIDLTPELVEDLRLEADVQSIDVFATLFGSPAACA